MTVILEADKLVKSYSRRRVVDELSLSVRTKSVLGLLGPNGAGKTTTLRMLYGFVRPESGEIRYRGQSFAAERTALKRLIGVCTQDDTLDYDLSVAQNLRVYARYFRPIAANTEERISTLLDRFGLDRYRDASPHALSGGYKRRLLIARSIVHEPSVLFLDEPTTGLDPKARVDVWELVNGMREEGMAIILTTHYMDEAERLSDDLLVMSEGRGVAHGTPSEVVGRVLGEHVLVAPASADVEAIARWIERELGKRGARVLGELRVALDAGGVAKATAAFPDVRFGVRPPDLDDLFLALSIEPPKEPEE
jgi:lipooligosaccharide transport system ATP-binding protein